MIPPPPPPLLLNPHLEYDLPKEEKGYPTIPVLLFILLICFSFSIFDNITRTYWGNYFSSDIPVDQSIIYLSGNEVPDEFFEGGVRDSGTTVTITLPASPDYTILDAD